MVFFKKNVFLTIPLTKLLDIFVDFPIILSTKTFSYQKMSNFQLLLLKPTEWSNWEGKKKKKKKDRKNDK